MKLTFTMKYLLLLFFIPVLITTHIVSAQQQLSKFQLIEYAKLLRGTRTQPLQLTDNKQISLIKESCGTLQWLEFKKALEIASLKDKDRNEVLSIFDMKGEMLQYNTPAGNFKIFYTTDNTLDQVRDHDKDSAVNVKLADETTIIGRTIAGNNHPDYVEIVGIWFEHSLEQYHKAEFRNPAANDQITVTIKNYYFEGKYTEEEIQIDNNIGDDLLQHVPTHELFHGVQHQYDPNEWEKGGKWITEGSARWAEDMINDHLNYYMGNTRYYLWNMNESLIEESAYKAVLLFKYITEQYTEINTEPIIGTDVIKTLLEAIEDYDGVEAVDQTIRQLPKGWTFRSTFKKWLIANYLKDKGDPYPDPVYEYLEDEHLEYNRDYGFGDLKPMETYKLTTSSGPFTTYREYLHHWAANYYVIKPSSTVKGVKVKINALDNYLDPKYLILSIMDNDLEIYESRSRSYTEIVRNPSGAIDELVVIVSAFESGGEFSVTADVYEGIILSLSPSPITMKEGTGKTLTAYVTEDDESVSEAVVTFSLSETGNVSVSPTSITTGNDGKATTTVSSKYPGSVMLTGTATIGEQLVSTIILVDIDPKDECNCSCNTTGKGTSKKVAWMMLLPIGIIIIIRYKLKHTMK